MQVLYSRCAGFDVHKDSVMVCLLIDRAQPVVRQFATTTAELLRLRDFLVEHRIRHVAMESTGVYWKPIWNILEEEFDLMLVNAQHVKQVPGRGSTELAEVKTDVSDCQWIADLLRHGLVRPSFVPPSPQPAVPAAGPARAHAPTQPARRRAGARGQPHPEDAGRR